MQKKEKIKDHKTYQLIEGENLYDRLQLFHKRVSEQSHRVKD